MQTPQLKDKARNQAQQQVPTWQLWLHNCCCDAAAVCGDGGCGGVVDVAQTLDIALRSRTLW